MQKRIENGYLHILLNGVKYNAQGAVVEWSATSIW
jgi:hypothetical protein